MFGFNYSSFEIGVLIFVIAFCIYTVLGRICTCIETCAQAKCMEKIYTQNPNIKPGDISKTLKEIQDGSNS